MNNNWQMFNVNSEKLSYLISYQILTQIPNFNNEPKIKGQYE